VIDGPATRGSFGRRVDAEQPEDERPQRLLSIGGHLHEHQPTAVRREGVVVELGHQPGVIVELEASDQEEEDVVDEERRVGVDGDRATQDPEEQRAIVGVMLIVVDDDEDATPASWMGRGGGRLARYRAGLTCCAWLG
jgi:hypothetical protein